MKSFLIYTLYVLAFIGLVSMSMQFIMIWNISTDPYLYAAMPGLFAILVSCIGIFLFAIGWPVVYLIWRRMK